MLELYFSPRGRINRLKWWLHNLIATLVGWSIGLTLYVLMLSTNPEAETEAIVLLLLPISVKVWCYTALSIKRLHDQDLPAWWLLLTLIPFVGALLLIGMVGFGKGTEGPNGYGIQKIDTL